MLDVVTDKPSGRHLCTIVLQLCLIWPWPFC